jgi:RsiW-degrading membrane proteinase PrsW (M82 family)
MAVIALFILGAVAPAAFLLHFVYVRDKWEREPVRLVLRVYLISFLTVVPAVFLEAAGQIAVDAAHTRALLKAGLIAFVVVGLAEEGSKFIFLRWLVFSHREFDEVYDGILYAVAVGLGFATVENVLYVLSAPGFEARIAILIVRAGASVPVHALLGVIMGYYVGRAKFAPDPAARRRLFLTGLLLAGFCHGLYDFLLLSMSLDQAGGLKVSFGLSAALLVILMWVVGVRLIHRAQDESPFKRPSPLVRPLMAFNPAYKFCTRCGTPALRADAFCRRCGAGWGAPATVPEIRSAE